jgi:hypothetical protein
MLTETQAVLVSGYVVVVTVIQDVGCSLLCSAQRRQNTIPCLTLVKHACTTVTPVAHALGVLCSCCAVGARVC